MGPSPTADEAPPATDNDASNSYKFIRASLTQQSARVRRYGKERNWDFGLLHSEHQTVNEETWL